MQRWIAARALFPVTLAGALAAAYALLERGLAPSAVIGVGSGLAIVIVALGERLLPFDPAWNRSRGDVRTDLLHSMLSSYAARELYKVGLVAALLPLATTLSRHGAAPLWPHAWPLAAQVMLAAVLAEAGQYAAHRLGHEWEPAWRLHSTHHSPERLYWLNAGRDHPLGVLMIYAAEGLPLVLLGCPASCLTLFFVLESVHGLFQHGNIDVRLGPLNWIFSGPELHRWHHSTQVAEANGNYGATLICWDVLLRTRFLPDRRAPAAIGIGAMPDFPRGYLGQLLVPFRWERLKRA